MDQFKLRSHYQSVRWYLFNANPFSQYVISASRTTIVTLKQNTLIHAMKVICSYILLLAILITHIHTHTHTPAHTHTHTHTHAHAHTHTHTAIIMTALQL